MSIATGPAAPTDGEWPKREGEPAATTNQPASSQTHGVETRGDNLTTPAGTDTTTTHTDLDAQGRDPRFPLPIGARVLTPATETEEAAPAPAPETTPLRDRRVGRRALVIGGGAAVGGGLLAYLLDRLGGGDRRPTPPSSVPSAGGPSAIPEATATPEQPVAEAYPGNPEGDTPLNLRDSWLAALEWALNNADNTNPEGRTGLEVIESTLFMPKAQTGDFRTEQEIGSSMFLDLARNFADAKRLEAQGLNALQPDPYLRVTFANDPGDSMFIPGSQANLGFNDPNFSNFALAGTLRITWRNPNESAPVPLNSSWQHPSMSLKGTYAFSEGQGAENGVSEFDGWQMTLFKAAPRQGEVVNYPYVYIDGQAMRPY